MAGFGETTPATAILPTNSERAPSLKRPLPNGPCNYRDPASGTCGCDQFWDKYSAELHEGSKEHRSSSERSTWCVCGHHACFHAREPRPAAGRPQPSVAGAHHRAHAGCDARCQLQPGSQGYMHRGVRSIEEEIPPLERSQPAHNGRLKFSHMGSSQLMLQEAVNQANEPTVIEEARGPPSQPSTSDLPRVPSVCFLSHDLPPAARYETRKNTSQPPQNVTGLGLSLMTLGNGRIDTDRRQSVSSTVPDEMNISKPPHGSYSEPELPSTRANSIPGEHEQVISPARGPLDPILEFNRNLHLDISGDTIPNTYNPDDCIQSATEVATPSNANTPDLRAVDQAVHDTRKLVENMARMTSNAEYGDGSDIRSNGAMSAPAAQLLLTNSPANPQEHLEHVLRSASPQALHKLMSYLNPLHNLLSSMPNVANTIRELNTRVDLLENNSFNHIQPEDLHQQFETYDGRLLELEHRMDDHDRLHQAIDADQSSNSFSRRRIATITESFSSNHSVQSTTSSALIVAAVDRNEIQTEFGSIKDRLDILEAAALPTTTNPWEVEIVLLPWGRELRGIWFSPDDPMHDSSKATTQDSEEWTQARGLKPAQQSFHSAPSRAPERFERDADSSPPPNTRLSSRSSVPFSDTESGWSSQAISEWAAGSVDEWLSPKACGSNNLVYKRLQSRGFVRDVTLKSASARDIQATLSKAFIDLLEHLKYTQQDEDPAILSFPGLRASFIPLRKVMKESKLRFLAPAEMSSSALWSAQFLASGVMMRVSGGKKRLYVTQREAYLQQSDQMGSSWTWQELRLLPRFEADSDSQVEGNEAQVAEADAREACWTFFEAYDAPPASVASSFTSHHSAQLSIRPADRQWRRSITPSSILKHRQFQPISPLSENHPRRPSQGRNRTVSASLIQQAPQGSSKRRFNASPVKHSSAPHPSSGAPSGSVVRLKRRRVARSSSPRPNGDRRPEAQGIEVPVWNYTPRRSREPQSPFFSSVAELPRSNSDVASRSQRSVAVVGKSTPFAYATPHSGPFAGEADFGGFGDREGDTEPDDNIYEDDGEQSWRGVEDEDKNSGGDSDSDVEAGADEPASFSGDDSGFGTEEEEDDDDAEEGDDEFGFGAQRQNEDEDDDGDEIFDTLLGVLQH